MAHRLSDESYRLVGITTATMGAIMAATGLYLTFRETESILPVIFLLSWATTFLATAYCARLKLQLIDLEAKTP